MKVSAVVTTPPAGCRADYYRTGGESGGFGPRLPLPFSESLGMSWSRRELLAAGGAVALTALTAGRLEGAPKRRNQQVMYLYNVRGRRASRASKAFCANLRFKTTRAAGAHQKPHLGFNGRLVGAVVTAAEYQSLFPGHVVGADLRHLK